MEWISFEIHCAPEALDALMDRLEWAGVSQFAVEDPRELDDFLQHSVYYDYVEDELMQKRQAPATLTVYLPDNAQGHEQREVVRGVLSALEREGAGSYDSNLVGISEEDWKNNWKKYFKPIRVGEKILIKPSWEPLPEDVGSRKVLEIDPSSSFGTGTHETTRLCLAALEEAVFPGAEVLDMGCGSGILGVGAMLLGAGNVTGIDIEEDAIRVSGENMRRNAVEETAYRFFRGNVLEDDALRDLIGQRKYDVIAANIVADVIIAMSALFGRFLEKDGTLIASGIILERQDEVKEALSEAGFAVARAREEGEWVALTLKRKA